MEPLTEECDLPLAAYQQITRSRTSLTPINELSAISLMARTLFEAIELEDRSIRLLGISLSKE